VLERVEIRNWQSLRHVELPLGRFTVIVGASSSGKSALMRAFRALASNTTGTAAITRGADTAAITARTADAVVTLEHRKGAWFYRVLSPETGERDYTKLNRSVPEDVTRLLNIQPVPTGGSSINFAGQFDGPYLLSDTHSASSVARTLGALTNVDRIYAAVGVANKRYKARAATLKTRRADRDALVEEARGFADLKHQLAVCARAERIAEDAARLSDRLDRLRGALDALDVAETVLARTQAPSTVPSDERVLQARERLDRFVSLLREQKAARDTVHAASRAVADAKNDETAANDEIWIVLHEAGTCPTCEQPIK